MGFVHLRGEQGRLEIHYDADRGKWYAHMSFKVSKKTVRMERKPVPQQPKGCLVAGIDIGINNLSKTVIYIKDYLTRLVNSRRLKAISHYWRMKIAECQSTLNKYGLKTSKRLRLMYSRWGRQVRSYINAKVKKP